MTDKDLDRWLAENLMGWKLSKHTGMYWQKDGIIFYSRSDIGSGFNTWHPTSDIAQAMMVADYLCKKKELHYKLNSPFIEGEPYWAGFTPMGVTGWNGRPDFAASADTLEMAICLAAQEAWEGK